jgi:ribose 1,5-bisphosphokinase
MTGTFVAVVGPSGAGKDSLIRFAQEHLGDQICLVRRVVTRSADGNAEDHDTLDPEGFLAAEAQGAFALSWAAHGLRYGLPITLERELDRGRVVVANLSRGVMPGLLERYPGAVVVCVVAEASVLAERLLKRGRETPALVQRRLARGVAGAPLPAGTITLDNSGPLGVAGSRFVGLLRELAEPPARAPQPD